VIVVLQSQQIGFPVSDTLSKAMISEARAAGFPISRIFIEYLDLVRRTNPEQRIATAHYLQEKLGHERVVAVVAEGEGAVRFLAQEGRDLFPGALLVSNTLDPLGSGFYGTHPLKNLPLRPDYEGGIRAMLAARPGANKVLVVLGASSLDVLLGNEIRKVAEHFKGSVEFEYTDTLNFEPMLARAARASEREVILFMGYFTDASGRRFVPVEVLRKLSQVARAPIIGTIDLQLEYGATGGVLISMDGFGRQMARIALDQANGRFIATDPAAPPPLPYVKMFDWSQVLRWGIDPTRLPSDAVLLNKPPTLWEQFRSQVILTAVAFVLMSALMVALLAQNRRRKHAEQAASESEARMRVLIDAAPEAITVYDVERDRFVDANPRALQLFGCDRDTLFNASPRYFYRDPSNQPGYVESSVQDNNRRVLAGEEVVVQRTLVRASDGVETPCEVRLVRMPSHAHAQLLRVSYLDITESHAIESALYFVAEHRGSSQDRVAFLRELAAWVCPLLHLDVCIISRRRDEQQAQTVVVWPALPEGQDGVFDVPLAGCDEPHLQPAVQVVPSAARSVLPGHPLLQRWAGESYVNAQLLDSQGELIGCFTLIGRHPMSHPERAQTVVQIVAARVAQELEALRAEQEALSYQQNLEAQVSARTAELANTNEALAAALDKAESATRAKSLFLANMSHEIRTPMNAIIGLSRQTLKTPLSDQQQDYLSKIERSGQHLLGIINDILDFSKIEAGKMRVEQIPFDVAAVMANLSDLYAERAAAKGLTIAYHMAPDVPNTVVGDPLRLGQILINYVGNAIKFTERGHIDVTMTVLGRNQDRVILECSVADTGVGLTPDQRQRLFRGFEQADPSTSRQYGGTGLGLAISRKLAELMGGSVGVESQAGQGSRFWLRVPLGIAQANATRNPPPSAWSGRKPSPEAPDLARYTALRGRRVLLVEDNEINQQVALELLREVGVEVDIAGNGRVGVEMAGQRDYDAVLMDMQMPEMDGLEATRRLRAMPELAGLPIIAMTANALVEDRQQCVDAGMDDFITKPIEPEQLWQVLLQQVAGDQAVTWN